MDRSVDSIGSCSLDVDADSSDVSDTSGSLNFATPLSAKDITREFTAKITERCQLSQNTTTYLDPVSGQIHTIVTPTESADKSSTAKKPSYLNLACCVNGYSNLTTYDSKVRQDINKSREVSPIRPSTNSIQHCKKNNSLAPPIIISTTKTLKNSKANMTSNQYLDDSSGSNDTVNMVDVVDAQYLPQQSFIQQRVERLYGPGALAQVFYSPKKIKPKNSNNNTILNERSTNTQTEFCRKYQQLSSTRYSNQCNKNSTESDSTPRNNAIVTDVTDHSINNTIDLPVLRHLSQEFRAQLPSISPKRSYMKSYNTHSIITRINVESNNHDTELHNNLFPKDNCNEGQNENKSSSETSVESLILASEKCNDGLSINTLQTKQKDGNYFLEILKQEQSRLLELAHRAEKYICSLTNNADISEEVFGLLRSAAGKARLLVSQKMKQFEGLCHNNLNRSPEDAFPTTIEDLQGFWDMVYLQVGHIDSIFEEIEDLKNNDWKMKPIAILPVKPQKALSVFKTTGSNQKTTSILNGCSQYNGSNGNMSAAALKREAQRKQLMELKRRNKMAMNTDNAQTKTASAIEIFVNENNS